MSLTLERLCMITSRCTCCKNMYRLLKKQSSAAGAGMYSRRVQAAHVLVPAESVRGCRSEGP